MIKVKLQDLLMEFDFQSDESSAYLNVKTGELCTFTVDEIDDVASGEDLSHYPEWQQEVLAKAKEFLEHEDDYIPLPTKFDFHEYRVMERFISHVPNPQQAQELYDAINGRGAFRMFRSTLERFDLLQQWYDYREESIRDLIKDWCEMNKISIIDAEEKG